MPWICTKCGEVADGAMCIRCGSTKSYTPSVRDPNTVAYTGGGAPIVDGGSENRHGTWGPITWVAVVLGVLFVAMVIFGTAT